MALDPNIQTYISTFIESQFPRLYDTYGPVFIDFVEAYFEWMETQGPIYDSRRMLAYQDIDTTVEKFIVYFKDKYLQNIQLSTKTNFNMLIKHSLDVYRSRGTPRNIDLVFRLIFGTGAQVYYPFDDVFKTSSGDWHIPLYLEVSTQDDLNKFVGKEIIGITSGATAFVESWVRKKAFAKQIDCLYISALNGNFVTGERINAKNSPFPLLQCPTMIGSLTSIALQSGGYGFDVGQLLSVQGSAGYGAITRVANTTQTTGAASFMLEDGGYAYTVNAEVLVSEYVLSLTNVQPGSTVSTLQNYFVPFETVQQPMCVVNYQSAVGGHFANNDTITAYYSNGVVQAQGTCLQSTNGTSTNGTLTLAVTNGTFASINTIYNQGNAISANLPVSGGFTNTTATGNCFIESLTLTATLGSISGMFLPNETVQDSTGKRTGQIISVAQNGITANATITNRIGVFSPGMTITGQISGVTANLTALALNIGVINATGTFIGDVRAPVMGALSNTSGVMPLLNQGSGASFSISNTLLYPETVVLNTDRIINAVSLALNGTYDTFVAFPTANLSTTLATALTDDTFTIGKISSLVSTIPGSGYNIPPMVRVYEPLTFAAQQMKEDVLTYSGATGAFAEGELITQGGTNARGLVLSSNSTQIVIDRLSLYTSFIPTTNSTNIITGTGSGTTANVAQASVLVLSDSEDLDQVYLGYDAVVDASAQSANGTITSLQILASGWGFEEGETISVSANGITALGTAFLENQGFSQGYYRSRDGFTSDIKKLPDNEYYQVSAYEVRASVAFEQYIDLLKQLLHVAGTAPFGAFVYRAVSNLAITAISSSIKQTI